MENLAEFFPSALGRQTVVTEARRFLFVASLQNRFESVALVNFILP
jgi:hypothetical protein